MEHRLAVRQRLFVADQLQALRAKSLKWPQKGQIERKPLQKKRDDIDVEGTTKNATRTQKTSGQKNRTPKMDQNLAKKSKNLTINNTTTTSPMLVFSWGKKNKIKRTKIDSSAKSDPQKNDTSRLRLEPQKKKNFWWHENVT